jgi:putative membrane protein (TIGR04086 family)
VGGVFLHKNGIAGGSLRLILKSLLLWTASALALLTIASIILSTTDIGSETVGYVSSAISFLCAVAAGTATVKQNGDKPLIQALVTAIILVILCLTMGFLARGHELNASGILSVVSFSISGVLLGSVLTGNKRRKTRKRNSRLSLSKKVNIIC